MFEIIIFQFQVCMAEWNRWPVFTAQKRKHIPFKQPNPYGHQGQLDYDLTLRDQRMLKNLNSIPRKTKLSLRNSLTLRYPAVPVPTKTHSETYNLKEDKDFNILGLTDPYIGTVVNKGFNLTEKVRKKYWQDKIDKALEGKERPKAYWEYPELEKGHIHKHCSTCFHLDCQRTKSFNEIDITSHDNCEACDLRSCRWNCGAIFHWCKTSEHDLICPAYIDVSILTYFLVRGSRPMNT